MATPSETQRTSDPCWQIQVDLSAMLDGELDPAGVRRVTVHSDACPGCRSFLDGVRAQVRVHRKLASVLAAEGDESAAVGGEARASVALRRQLTENQRKLARVLYELGRNFALMGLSPEFSREVGKEPVPVPDMAMRGRNLLDEVSRSAGGQNEDDWVAAKELFDGRQLRSPEENLARGQRLLTECLVLDPTSEDARIYLGLVHYARGQRALARKQFRLVLDGSSSLVMRGYALSNLSNIHLDEGDCDGAISLLLQLVESGAYREQPRLVAAFFNLGLAYGFRGGFDESMHWFGRLHSEAPHRRRWVAQELSRRSHFLHLVQTHPAAKPLAEALPTWFPALGPRAPEAFRDGGMLRGGESPGR
jgi:tetratricopeptide (TPR) repeat protein